MVSRFVGKSLAYLVFAFLTILLLVATRSSSLAHGKEHQPASEMAEHMQAMQSAKDAIPEEYQIMERTPIIADDASLRIGSELFAKNCAVCHGEKGDGNGPAAGSLPTPPANFLDTKHSSTYGPGGKYWIIGHGIDAAGMPEFSQLAPLERWHLVNYIFQLQQKKP